MSFHYLRHDMSIYKRVIRPFLFLMNPEQAHHFVFRFLKFTFKIPGIAIFVRRICSQHSDDLRRDLFGIPFLNPIGLAAGFDKDARMFNELSCFGFGFIEIGTVTPRPQPGNPSPRMFRLLSDEALVNRMGFNNDGVDAMVERLKASKHKVIIGGNIGKNKDTENEKATEDYARCFRALYNYVDYFAVNVSSPNTPGLRDLQEKEPLLKILKRLQELNDQLSFNKDNQHHKRKPLLLKISPDLGNMALDEIIEVCLEAQLDGIIATNTTVSRENLSSSADLILQNGGLSGKPLRKRSTEIIRYLAKKSGGKLIIIGAGGIHSAEDALEKIHAGASLIQLYTGFIYEGPVLIRQINKALIAEAQKNRSDFSERSSSLN